MGKFLKQIGIQMSKILLTGGTGSFGQAFVKYVTKNDKDVEKLIVYSRDEHKQELMSKKFIDERLRFFIGDVRDKDRLILAARECDYIVHAAALKVVPTGEYNPMEFVKTNIFGAQNIVDVALSLPYCRVLGLSTDKAVNPINLYGATKLCMEKLLLASNNLIGANDFSGFSIVRYGNVANSNGSVIPLFRRCWLASEPYPVTHRDMTRFWIELDEAAKFVYDKLVNFKREVVHIPNMPSFKISDLVKAFDVYGDVKIIGIRPGEKLHEQIDIDRFSNTNERFLTWQELRERLIKLGVMSI